MNEFKLYLNKIVPTTDSEFAKTLTYFKELHLAKGDFFIKANQVCTHIAFILKGTLRTYYLSNKAEEITSCFCTENNFATSYKSFILKQPSKLNIQAIEDSTLLTIDYESLQKLFSISMIWQTVGRILAEREYLVMEQYASMLNTESAKEKYLRLLKEQPSVLQKAKLEDVASYLGVTRRTLTRIRKELATKM